MRGKVRPECIGEKRVRITPAYAGKSCLHLYAADFQRDHPRLCGEKLPPVS